MKNILIGIFVSFTYIQIISAEEVVKEPQSAITPAYIIDEVINDFAIRHKKQILIDPRVKARVTLFGKSLSEISESDLYTILNIHGFSMVTVDDLNVIMPLVNIKQSNARINDGNSKEFSGSEIVTTYIEVKNIPAGQLIPILRPLVPQQGHLAAYIPTNKIILTDTYDNSKRISNIVKFLDTENDVTFTMKCKDEK